jgi:hypothetical protein
MLPKGLTDTAENRRIDFIGKFWIIKMTFPFLTTNSTTAIIYRYSDNLDLRFGFAGIIMVTSLRAGD